MSDPISFELRGLVELDAYLAGMPPTLRDKLRPFMAAFTLRLRDQVKANIADRFKSTGPLYQSVQSEMEETVGSISGRVYTDGVAYAAAQEYGARTPAHTIVPINAQALAFMSPFGLGFSSGGGANALIFAKKVNHPGSVIPERSYARLALAQLRAPFKDGIRAVVDEAMGTGAFAMAAQ